MILPPIPLAAHVETLIVGAGACGLVAALAAREAGQDVLVLERDAMPSGSTALSAGLIPAAGTRWQKAAGIADSPAQFAADIAAKAHGENDPAVEAALTGGAAEVLHWLADRHDLPFSVITDFSYPGHSARRMHGLPTRSGRELIDALRSAAERAGIDILTEARVTALHAQDGHVSGVQVTRPDGGTDGIGCDRLILACNGFGGNKAMVAQHMSAIADALYFGHPGNQGEAMTWGAALGAAIGHPGAYQGHGNVAHPHGIGAQLMGRLFGFGVSRPQLPWVVKRKAVDDPAALAAQFRAWAADAGLSRIIVSHGEVIAEDAAGILRDVADRLAG